MSVEKYDFTPASNKYLDLYDGSIVKVYIHKLQRVEQVYIVSSKRLDHVTFYEGMDSNGNAHKFTNEVVLGF